MALEHSNRMRTSGPQQQGQHQSMLDSCCEATDDVIREYPMAATFAMFAMGIAVGTAIGTLMGRPSRSTRARRTAEHLGRRVLHSLSDYVPDTVKHRIYG